jgi:hypothetical protein
MLVLYTLFQAEVEAAEARGDLNQVLDAAMAEVKNAVVECRLDL